MFPSKLPGRSQISILINFSSHYISVKKAHGRLNRFLYLSTYTVANGHTSAAFLRKFRGAAIRNYRNLRPNNLRSVSPRSCTTSDKPSEFPSTRSERAFSYPIAVVCHLLTDGALPRRPAQPLCAFLAARLQITSYLSKFSPYVSSAGPCCFVWLSDSVNKQQSHAFETKHSFCLKHNAAVVVRSGSMQQPMLDGLPPMQPILPEFLLVPMWGFRNNTPPGTKFPIFAVFAVTVPGAQFLLSNVLRARRLPLIFDLDETLIKARTINGLAQHMETLGARPHSPVNVEEKKLAQADLDKLQTFYDRGTLDGRLGQEQWETKYDEAGNPMERVKHLVAPLDGEAVLVQIQADKVKTMLFRIRPNWWYALDRLKQSKSVEVFVCTTATHEDYAHEVWRTLDPEGVLIPAPLRTCDTFFCPCFRCFCSVLCIYGQYGGCLWFKSYLTLRVVSYRFLESLR
jgi:hypothetical protein